MLISISVCSYLDPAEYAARFSNLKHVSIMSFNIQSLSAKKKELIHMLSCSRFSPDVICLQEIWPNSVNPTLTQTEKFAQFLEIFSNIDNQIASLNIPSRIVGDFNVDVHKIRPP
jgi:hypothetical protein